MLCAMLVSVAHARVITVQQGGAVSTISQAISIAQPHDEIVVTSGTYHEQLLIDKPLKISGVADAVIDGDKRGTNVEVTADDVTIGGLTIVNSARSSLRDYCGIHVSDARRVNIIGNKLRSNQFSIMLQNCADCRVIGNDVSSDIDSMPVMGNAIHCWKCDSLYVGGNSVGHNRDGIYFEFVYNSLIERNVVEGCERYGLHFMFSHFNVYRWNRFSRNLAGVAVMYTHNVEMTENVFENNAGGSAYGLLLKDISHAEIKGNKLINNTVAVLMDGGTNLMFHHNDLKGNGWGMRIVASSQNDTITANNFVGNTFDLSSNGSYNSNVFDGNFWDKYNGYDLNSDGSGDVPYHPLSLYTVLAERNAGVLLFFRSLLMSLLNEAEHQVPSLTPDSYVDNCPLMTQMSYDSNLKS